ncbi:MAG: hypothetical protein K8L91_23885 [Anaerolineae bacterium]|nr:hypothetical protein [Anaerolineae bacterium]
MHHVRKFVKWVRLFFAPSIPYTLVVAESPENCLRKIERKFPMLSIEITSDEHGNSHFRIHVARTDPETLPAMIVTGKVETLDTQKTIVSGAIHSWVLGFFMFMLVAVCSITLVVGIANGDLVAIGFGIIGVLFGVYGNFMYRKHAYLWLTSTLQYVLES